MTEKGVRELTEKGAANVKDAYDKAQATAGEATKVMQQTYSAASKGTADFNLQFLDIAEANIKAAFDFARELAGVTSPSQFLELSTAHARKQFETFTEQTRHLTTAVHKLTNEVQPLGGITKTFSKRS